jgi:FMN reductase
VTLALVVGNPKSASRTLEAAVLLGRGLTGGEPDVVVDVVTLGPGLLGWGDPVVAEAVAAVAAADVVIVASPTFKATYTGIVKLFLDQFSTGAGLKGVVAVALMLGAGPGHAMAPDLLLKPVLVELGATCPTPGLYLRETTYHDGRDIDAFTQRWAPMITASLGVGRDPVDG